MNSDTLAAGCTVTYKLPGGYLGIRDGKMTHQEWFEECETVADLLDIHVVDHLGRDSSEYIILTKSLPPEHPMAILGTTVMLWLSRLANPDGSRGSGGTMTAVFFEATMAPWERTHVTLANVKFEPAVRRQVNLDPDLQNADADLVESLVQKHTLVYHARWWQEAMDQMVNFMDALDKLR